MSIRSVLFGTILLVLGISCTSVSLASGDVGGTWKGESLCTVRPSPCKDETVIYTITEPDAKGALTIDADKVVNGARENMGKLDCTYDKAKSTVVCMMKNGKWEFTISGTSMKGTLTLPDGTLYRKVSLTKDLKD
jgi:hypothetical protein